MHINLQLGGLEPLWSKQQALWVWIWSHFVLMTTKCRLWENHLSIAIWHRPSSNECACKRCTGLRLHISRHTNSRLSVSQLRAPPVTVYSIWSRKQLLPLQDDWGMNPQTCLTCLSGHSVWIIDRSRLFVCTYPRLLSWFKEIRMTGLSKCWFNCFCKTAVA